MKRLLVLAAVILAGCEQPQRIELLAECFAGAAYEAIRVESLAESAPDEPKKCCGECKNGLVKSGDGLAWVSCPCDDGCQCKKKVSLQPACTTGTCRK